MQLITAPKKYLRAPHPWIYLAGSIELGKACPWQDDVVKFLAEKSGTLLNPRRRNWRTINFKQQVDWELNALEASDVILLYFDPKTKSPISLLELGLFARSKKIYCACPKSFWRYGNVKAVCRRYRIPLYASWPCMLRALNRLKKL